MKWYRCVVLVMIFSSAIPDPAARIKFSEMVFDNLYENGIEPIMVGDGSDDAGYLEFTFMLRAHTREGAEKISEAFLFDAVHATQWGHGFGDPQSNATFVESVKA